MLQHIASACYSVVTYAAAAYYPVVTYSRSLLPCCYICSYSQLPCSYIYSCNLRPCCNIYSCSLLPCYIYSYSLLRCCNIYSCSILPCRNLTAPAAFFVAVQVFFTLCFVLSVVGTGMALVLILCPGEEFELLILKIGYAVLFAACKKTSLIL